MLGVKITVTNYYYIVKYPSYNYYFDRETYRILKIEIFNNIKVWNKTTYTYFYDEEISPQND